MYKISRPLSSSSVSKSASTVYSIPNRWPNASAVRRQIVHMHGRKSQHAHVPFFFAFFGGRGGWCNKGANIQEKKKRLTFRSLGVFQSVLVVVSSTNNFLNIGDHYRSFLLSFQRGLVAIPMQFCVGQNEPLSFPQRFREKVRKRCVGPKAFDRHETVVLVSMFVRVTA